MVLNTTPNGDNSTMLVYNWQEREVSSTSTGAEDTFEFTAKATRRLKSLTGINTNPEPTKFEEDTTNGQWSYYKYATGSWTLTTGHRHQRDCDVYFRINGVDYPVDGASTQITSVSEGTTNIEIVFAANVTETDADEVILSYAYQDVANPVPSSYWVKDFNPKQNGRDFTAVPYISGIVQKRRAPADLTEITFTVGKNGIGLASALLGKYAVFTENSLSVKSVSGGNYTRNWAISVVTSDPDNSKSKIGFVMVNCGGTALDHKGGADSDLEESVAFKCDPECYGEFDYTTT